MTTGTLTAPTVLTGDDALAAYVELLWEGLSGYVLLAFGVHPHSRRTSSGRPQYHHGFIFHEWVRFVDPEVTVDVIYRRTKAEAPHHDVYVAPLLHKARSARKGHGANGRYAWVDVDGDWTTDRQETWETVTSARPGCFTVHSGRGRHLYVPLDEPLPAADIVKVNHRLARAFDGDSKWAENSLLRLPGTFNHKGRILDKSNPFPTTLEFHS